MIHGRLSMHRDGYGFLIPDEPVPGVKGDIYLAKEAAERAHARRPRGRAHSSALERDGRADGEIVKVLKRAHPTVVGEFRMRRARELSWSRTTNASSNGSRFRKAWRFRPPPRSPDRIGAQHGAKCTSDEDLDGMIVNVEMLEYGDDGDRPVGRVIEILGHPDDFGIDVEIVIRKHHLPHQFPG